MKMSKKKKKNTDTIIQGKSCEMTEELRMGDDGVEEVHVNYNATPGKLFFSTGLSQERYDSIFGKKKPNKR
jgi:hypothetical protein